jgi:hypothetical protein
MFRDRGLPIVGSLASDRRTMPSPDLAREEFAALRATVRERGTLRVALFAATIGGWALLLVVTQAGTSGLPAATLLPLLVLAAGFEAIFALHLNVERLGRYLQACYESPAEPGTPRWEGTAMAYGQLFPGSGSDPLFSVIFLAAALLNYLPVAIGGLPAELAALGVLHLAVPLRMLAARRRMARQRSEDLERFRRILAGTPPVTSSPP